ncbi:flagellar protein FlhE [Halomonas sp. ML-15]|uniref:flagellar protein FlhE n=1 Tax=Halomonas sp. ML-15 TaxID=2773305 RepID=UPI0017462672|nr:flagellar protein FlhE [Halomonas sp. ML-15]MBD3894437.1 flagellar protein FlhE [Halomonas sp. ML-15]
MRAAWVPRLGALAVLAACAQWGMADTAAVSGSWIAETDGVRVAVPGRDTHSRPLAPGPGVPARAQISQVGWQYATPPGTAYQAWLCHPQRCMRLGSSRGRSEALAGLSASEPLTFRFRLGAGSRPAQISELQVFVDYRRPVEAKAQKTVGQ